MRKKGSTVKVVSYGDRPYFLLQWTDPMTGKKKTKTTEIERNGGKRARSAAEKEAGKLEEEITQGRYHEDVRIDWAGFRQRYEDEKLRSLAVGTADKVATVFNAVEAILNPQRLSDLTADRLSYFQSKLRETGCSEATLRTNLAHLRAALAWAADLGLIRAVPKIVMPKRAKSGKLMKGRPLTLEEFERMVAAVPAALYPRQAPSQRRRGKRREDAKPPTPAQRYRHLVGAVAGGQDSSEPQDVAAVLEVAERTAEQLAADVEAAKPIIASWQRYLWGLWYSGLRLRESLDLFWDRDDKLCVVLDGKRPMLRIPGCLEKGGQDRLLPMAPEFAESLQQTPEAERSGAVFTLRALRNHNQPLTWLHVSRVLSAIGEVAGVKVNTDARTSKVKYASAHDLRRSFGERWATRVMPQVLMELMRHESIETTMRFYVGKNAQRTADVLWDAHKAAQAKMGKPGIGNSSGNSAPIGPGSGSEPVDATLTQD